MITTRSTVCCTSLEQVGRDEHGAALGGELAQEAADPADALGVEAVDRLVEHEHARVAEQREREAEALAHAERVAADPAIRVVGEADLVEHRVDARASGCRPPSRRRARWFRAERPG